MPGPLVAAGTAIGTATVAGLTVDTIGRVFDKTAKEICKCLDKIDRTLIDGFAGLGIEIKKLPPPLGGGEGATRPRVDFADFVSTAEERRAREDAATDRRTRAEQRADALARGAGG